MTASLRIRPGFTVVRSIDSPIENVFRAWTDPEHLGWFAGPLPPEHPTTVDLRVGGTWRFHMVVGPDNSYTTGGIYREIDPPRRLVFAWGAVGGWPESDPEFLDDVPQVAVSLEPNGDGTRMTMEVAFPSHFSDQDVEQWINLGVRAGWNDTVGRLGPWLAEEDEDEAEVETQPRGEVEQQSAETRAPATTPERASLDSRDASAPSVGFGVPRQPEH